MFNVWKPLWLVSTRTLLLSIQWILRENVELESADIDGEENNRMIIVLNDYLAREKEQLDIR